MIILITVTLIKITNKIADHGLQMTNHGGKRNNAGRKEPVSPFGEKTTVIRVPTSIKQDVLSYLQAFKKANPANATKLQKPRLLAALNPQLLSRPIYSGKVSAGQSRFPSPRARL